MFCILAQQVAQTFWGVLSNTLSICRGYGGYCAVMHTLPQVNGGTWVGVHYLSWKADVVRCKKNCISLTNYVQNLRVIAQLFTGAGVGVASRRCSSHNRRAWLQSQRILRRIVGHLLGCSCRNFATTTVDGKLEQESNLQVLKKCSSGRQKKHMQIKKPLD